MVNITHETQLGILNKLLFATRLRYTDLKYDKSIENNTFQFHLNKVIAEGFVVKTKDYYSLTQKGKKFATHLDTDKNKIVELRKVSVHLFCIRTSKTHRECLMYTRLKHPFYGKQGFPAGKAQYGETFVAAAKRELKEETNLTGNPVLFNIAHILVKDKKTKELLDDKIFLDFFVENPKGKLIGNNEGKYSWIPVDELEKHITKPFDNIAIYKEAFKAIEKFAGQVNYSETEHLTLDF